MLDKKSDILKTVAACRSLFKGYPELVPAGGVDVSGNGRWRIWEFAGTKIDAPIMGNGDMLCAYAGSGRYPNVWVTTNDFWQMESNPNWEFFHDNANAAHDPVVALGSPRPVGRFVFDIPALESAEFSAELDISGARLISTYKTDTVCLRVESFVAAGENVYIAEFIADCELTVKADFMFPDEIGCGCDKGVDCFGMDRQDVSLKDTFVGLIGGAPLQVKRVRGGVISGWREFSDKVDVPTKVGFAGRFLNEQTAEVTLKPGEKKAFVAVLRSWAKTSRPYEYALSRASYITENDISALKAAHKLWWNDYFSVSGIKLSDKKLENAYYLSQYMMGSLSGDYDYPPNILGISTFDRMAWNGNYKINYNHQSPYLGLLASGHFKQADAHDAPYLAMLDISREMSRRLLSHEGAYLPLGLGPVGMVSEPLLLHMKSPAVHGAINMIMRYELSRDREYLKRMYPFLHDVAVFWENDLVKDKNGKYRTVDDGMHERTTRETTVDGVPENACNTLGYLKAFFRAMPGFSEELGLDEERRAKWRDIFNNLSDYPTSTPRDIDKTPFWRGASFKICEILPESVHDLEVFCNEEIGNAWSVKFPGNIMHIYPAGEIGLSSDKRLLEIARNTVKVRAMQEDMAAVTVEARSGRLPLKSGAWNDTNISCLFFPAAVRVGFDAETIAGELRLRLDQRGYSNGFIKGNPHGIENLSTVPNTLQEMMLLSHEGVIRVFEVFPRISIPDAEFIDLRAYGAFLVSAKLENGEVRFVEITSDAGEKLKLQNPWPGEKVVMHRVQKEKVVILSGACFETDTFKGEKLVFEKAGYNK